MKYSELGSKRGLSMSCLDTTHKEQALVMFRINRPQQS